ncbi:MAG: hypothetical protein JO306_13005 [Gemmatimonadetes bacterium]|nr:hypothetical protein [Gemmatimonadota bacterium]
MPQTQTLVRSTSAAFVAAGACLVLWATLHPWDHLTGAAVGQSVQWIAAHTFHFLSGLLLLGALAGFAVLRVREASRFGTVAAAVWFAGSALWTGTGMITAYVWPTLAAHAPAMTEASGPIFSPPHPLIVVTNLLFSLGMVLTAIAMARAGLMSVAGAAVMALGGASILVPPHPIGPAPWAAFVAGAVLAGLGTAWMGISIRRLGTAPAAISRPLGVAAAAAR